MSVFPLLPTSRPPHPQRLLWTASILYGGVFTLLAVYSRPALGLGHGFYLPIVLVALAMGPVAGAFAGASAIVLYELALHMGSNFSWTLLPTTSAAMVRFVSYVVTGTIVGFVASPGRQRLADSLKASGHRFESSTSGLGGRLRGRLDRGSSEFEGTMLALEVRERELEEWSTTLDTESVWLAEQGVALAAIRAEQAERLRDVEYELEAIRIERVNAEEARAEAELAAKVAGETEQVLTRKRDELEFVRTQLVERDQALDRREADLEARVAELDGDAKEISEFLSLRISEIAARENDLDSISLDLDARANELEEYAEKLVVWAGQLEESAAALHREHQANVALAQIENRVVARLAMIEQTEHALREREAALDERERQVGELQKQLEWMRNELFGIEQSVTATGAVGQADLPAPARQSERAPQGFREGLAKLAGRR